MKVKIIRLSPNGITVKVDRGNVEIRGNTRWKKKDICKIFRIEDIRIKRSSRYNTHPRLEIYYNEGEIFGAELKMPGKGIKQT